MEPDQAPDLTQAFPEGLRTSVRAVLEAMPDGPSTQQRSPDDIGVVTLNGHRLRIPARIYKPEPDWSWVWSMGVIEQSIAACLYTRHHDGHVRERALAHISTVDEPWVAPFVIQLLGEYVIELVERVASLIEEEHPKHAYCVFLRENPDFLNLTAHRATSYWNEYYRQRFRKREATKARPT